MQSLVCTILALLVFVQLATPSDYTYYEAIRKSYKFHMTPLTWNTAQSICVAEGGTLAMPKDDREARVLSAILEAHPAVTLSHVVHKDYIFLGFHDHFDEGEYLTLKGDPIQYYFHKWASGQPDNLGNEDCGSLHRSGGINDFPCLVPGVFVCEKNNLTDFAAPVDPNCMKSGYKYSEVSKMCYKLHLNPKKWSDARDICYSEGGQLAIIRSSGVEKYLSDLFNQPDNRVTYVVHKNYALLGFHDQYAEGQYVTVDGGSLHSVGYENWAPGQPDNAGNNENCGSMTGSGQLNDFPCSVPAVFICEQASFFLNVRTQLQ